MHKSQVFLKVNIKNCIGIVFIFSFLLLVKISGFNLHNFGGSSTSRSMKIHQYRIKVMYEVDVFFYIQIKGFTLCARLIPARL